MWLFLESFASSLNIPVEKFAKLGLYAKAPVDLGTKCTVFMNSKVKQAQKEGVMISDLSAGLAYSVIKNALYKVIKLRNEKELGEKIVVQGGSFYNDALLRAIELILDRKVIRPEISGLMGAYGAALYSKDHEMDNKTSSLLTKDALIEFSMNTSSRRCDKCTNHCLLTINKFSNGESFISGNRCERGSGQEIRKEERLPNLYDYKYRRTFKYRPVSLSQARRGLIGIPRVLNMYENYPFWFTLLTSLGFRVILSPASSKNIYERGLETIPSESTCYPAKLCHGHIYSLIDQGVDTIFYPSVVYEKKEYKSAHNHYNCPVVISYPELIKNNIDEIKNGQVRFIAPFLSLDNEKVLAKELLRNLGITK